MTDRELLEAAAKAAGMGEMLAWTPGATPWLRVNPDLSRPWNPLTDDGDALRLAVRCDIEIIRPDTFTAAARYYTDDDPLGIDVEVYEEDLQAATRRAIVMAAAAMG